MSYFKYEYLKNEALCKEFRSLFGGSIYKMHGLCDQWLYETPKAKNRDNCCYFPEDTTEDAIEDLVTKSIQDKKDYVYQATKDTPEPEGVTEYYRLIDAGCVF